MELFGEIDPREPDLNDPRFHDFQPVQDNQFMCADCGCAKYRHR